MSKKIGEAIGNALKEHSILSLQVRVEDAHTPYYRVPQDFGHDEFCVVWSEYNDALFRSLHLYIRYFRQLLAWEKLLPNVGSDVVSTLIMDYVHPVFRTICDIPVTFKD